MTENPDFLTEQLITYIGNKRSLLNFISEGIDYVKKETGKQKLKCLDVFSGSGVVSRLLKGSSSFLAVNDLEQYARIISQCYLSNKSQIDLDELHRIYEKLKESVNSRLKELNDSSDKSDSGFISELYAPKDLSNVKKGERCFYTPYNAQYLDLMRQEIEKSVPQEFRQFFIAPLLSQASIHANTAGIFKGFYKNSKTGIGQFGGNGKNALSRICSNIELPFPVFSNNECSVKIFQQDANLLSQNEDLYKDVPDGMYDLAYLDPPYNQHPYGSNYFMLNLIADYHRPDTEKISRVSGIPKSWNRSLYNKKKMVLETFNELIKNLRVSYVLVSFNNEGFINREQMENLLKKYGEVTVLESKYNAFRGSRNLHGREIHVSEFLFVLKKNGDK